jgi:predicted transcriptional regulator
MGKTQTRVLRLLEKGSLSVIQIVDKLSVSRHSVNSVLRRLTESGLIERRKRNGVYVYQAKTKKKKLTKEQRHALEKIASVLEKADTKEASIALEVIRRDYLLQKL